MQLFLNWIKVSSIIYFNILSDAEHIYTYLDSIVYNDVSLFIILIMLSIFYRISFDMKLIDKEYDIDWDSIQKRKRLNSSAIYFALLSR